MYEVGDVLFIVSNKRRQIFPVQVVEQVVRRTLSGEETTYKVQAPSAGDKVLTVDLHSIDGTVHESIARAREFLYEQATSAIESMLATAQELARTFSGDSASPAPVSQTPAAASPKNGASKVKVKLDDGTSATVTLPEV
jgi:hypothetical protein